MRLGCRTVLPTADGSAELPWPLTGGATTNELMAIFDWDTPSQAKIYTDAADRKKMSGKRMSSLAGTTIVTSESK